mgnify:CR=1 FL=1
MNKIGIIGLGEHSAQHIQKIQGIHDFELVGVYDHNPKIAHKEAQNFGLKAFANPLELIEQAEIIDFVMPLPMDFEHICLAIKNSRHIFFQNQFLQDIQMAKKLIPLAEEARIKVQVSRSDRFNPAVVEARKYVNQPSYIETRRAITYSPSATSSNSRVMNLLLEDIDLILSFVESGVHRIQTRTNNPFSDQVDLINVRIEFDNGCAANINISSLSSIEYTKAAFYQENAVININLLDRKLEVLSSTSHPDKNLAANFSGNQMQFDGLHAEFQSFNNCIAKNTNPLVGLNEVSQALEILEIVKSQIAY